MLRQLAVICRPLTQQASLHLFPHSLTAVYSSHSFHSTPSAHGLEEFFEAPLTEDEKPRTGEPSYNAQRTSPFLLEQDCCKRRQRLEGR